MVQSAEQQAAATRPVIEVRSIDYVPPAVRHGKLWHQGPFWFTGNFVLTTLVTGFIGRSLGMALGWSVLAAVAGASFGTLFMWLYYLFSRSLDLSAEQDAVRRSRELLVGAA